MRTNITVGTTIDPRSMEYLSYTLSADARHYLRLARRLSLANRVVARTSDGPNPERFYMGGTWSFRGYPFYYFYGRNQLMTNTELRFPILDLLAIRSPLINFNLQGIQAALFFDTGQSWELETPDHLLGSMGASFRIGLGGYTALRFDFARRTDFTTIEEDWHFDFFFGWDY